MLGGTMLPVNKRCVVLQQVELVVDFAEPAQAGGCDQIGGDRVFAVVQQKAAADGGKVSLAAQRIGGQERRAAWSKPLLVYRVPPLAVVNVLLLCQRVIDGESKDVLNGGRGEGYIVLVLLETTVAAWEVRDWEETAEATTDAGLNRLGQIVFNTPLQTNCFPVCGS